MGAPGIDLLVGNRGVRQVGTAERDPGDPLYENVEREGGAVRPR